MGRFVVYVAMFDSYVLAYPPELLSWPASRNAWRWQAVALFRCGMTFADAWSMRNCVDEVRARVVFAGVP